MRAVLSPALLLALAAPAHAATWYVRTDGGTDAQCSGKADAPYPGSGSGQPCALAHPFWALTSEGAWRIAGGDTLQVGPGAYRIGYGAPNTAWCSSDGTWDCTLPALPSGTAGSPTRLVGAAWATGCSQKPQLWGAERANQVVSLNGTSNAVVACLEITDRSSCVESHSSPSVACVRDTYPHGDWAPVGIFAEGSSNVTLRDLDVHGLASIGIWAGRLTDWTLEGVTIAGNGSAGWNGDVGSDTSSNAGTITFSRVTVEWNGCGESYPGRQPENCWAQEAGGYGDGLGTANTGGRWVLEDSVFRYNTSDGLDLLYLGRNGLPGSAELRRVVAVGNAGNQIKVASASTLVNVLAVGNCAFFQGKSFATAMTEGDHCRALGASIALDPQRGDQVSLVNATVVGQGDCLLSAECETGTCDGSESVTIRSSVLRGSVDWRQPWEQACFLWDPSSLTRGRQGDNVVFGVKDNEGNCAAGAGNRCGEEPLFASADLALFDGHLTAGSPALDNGLPVGSLGLVPADDLEGTPRPQGAGVDRGAYERRSGGTAAYTYVLASVTHAPGAYGTLFRTDVAAVNRGASAANVTLTFSPTGGAPAQRTRTVPAGGTVEWADVLSSVFGAGAADSAYGALTLASDAALTVSSRTYNRTSAGTFGAYLPAVTAGAALAAGKSGYLPQLKKSASFRSNVGVVNLGGAPATVAIRLRGDGGAVLGSPRRVLVPAGGFVQESDVFTTSGAGNVAVAYATIDVETAGGTVWAFASVIDNATGDPTIVPLVVP